MIERISALVQISWKLSQIFSQLCATKCRIARSVAANLGDGVKMIKTNVNTEEQNMRWL